MSRLSFCVVFFSVCLLRSWAIDNASQCGPSQARINQWCCDMCLPGTYVVAFCTEFQTTVCRPCGEGTYANKHNMFDRCEPCQSCQQGYAEKCTKTTKGTCSCHHGFLCSNSICSVCVENKCTSWENVIKTNGSTNNQLTEYSYHCEPKCLQNQYFDLKEDTCKPRTHCGTQRLIEQFPGNTTHDSVCYDPAQRRGGDFIYIVITVGFVLLSLALFILVSFACLANLRKTAANKKPVQTVITKTSDFHLSKEESGFHLIIQDEVKDSNTFLQLDLEQASYESSMRQCDRGNTLQPE
ncbi:tumor necrosis factor receptor superfamily member 5-like isoform X2 [Kryptolebias marmoratus]|uniref:tumor necrosis factor receptor superfamily member 5-like isoform X2 n=1 Tax=Kryptolebias marmoratus TaxID=37003 RepID=UPI000D530587|nr:tumor necrosis factor receptor superfamily member 5-like isoform X2 [Kryptolebias marmoratus]